METNRDMSFPTDWTYRRTLTDSAATSVTDHVVRIVLDGTNFDFSRANSDGSDLRVYDSTAESLLPIWIRYWDIAGESAEVYTRVADITHEHSLYYGNASAESVSSIGDVFDWSDAIRGTAGNEPTDWTRSTTGGITLNDANNITAADAPAWFRAEVLATADISAAGTGDYKHTASRVPHQRCSFYAAGQWWLFYGDYSGGAPPFTLNVKTSTDGSTWSSATSLGTLIPLADAQWSIAFNEATGKLALCYNIQTGAVFHDGLMFRQGTPEEDGTITWDAVAQTVVAAGSFIGDFSIAWDSNGHLWVCYGNSGSTDETNGSAIVLRNASTDGTWSTASGFPATVHAGVAEDAFGILAPLADGAMHVTVYEWDTDAQAVAYTVASDGTVTADAAAMTELPVEADSGTAANVGRIDSMAVGGVVHYAYQSSSQTIRCGTRNVSGVYAAEVELAGSSFVTAAISSPRLAVANGRVAVLWTGQGGQTICALQLDDDSWSVPRVLFTESQETSYGHLMVPEAANGADVLCSYLTDGYELRSKLVSISAVAGDGLAIWVRKAVSSSGTHGIFLDEPSIGTNGNGKLIEFDLNVLSASANNDGDSNDNLIPAILRDSSDNNGPLLVVYGDGLQLGYIDSTNHKVSAVSAGFLHRVGIKLLGSAAYDLLLDGEVIASAAGYNNAAAGDLTKWRVQVGSRHTGSMYIDNPRVMPWVATEPDINVGAEQAVTYRNPIQKARSAVPFIRRRRR